MNVNTSKWNKAEKDALGLMLSNKSINDLYTNFRLKSNADLRRAIQTQITCMEWSEGTNEVQHFATYMLAGLAPEAKYVTRSIQLLNLDIASTKFRQEKGYEKEVKRLESAIKFISRFV